MSHSNGPYVVTLDVGTSSTRAILFDARGHVVPNCIAHRSNSARTSADGGAEFDIGELMENAVSALDQVVQRAGPMASQIVAVAMDTLVGNVMGVDADGAAITPVFTYADTRNAAQAQALRAELGERGAAAAHDRTGCLIHTSYLPARFRWLQEKHPQWWRTVERWVTIGEYFYYQLFGEWLVSYSVAAWTGLLNRRSLNWDEAWLEYLKVRAEQLSPLGDLTQPRQGLRPEWAHRWPALKDVLWYPAIGDGAAANIGSGCDAPDHVALTVGTTGAMRVVIDPGIETVPDGLWLYRVDGPRGLLGGATTEGGNVFAWLQDTLRLPTEDEQQVMLRKRAPAAHGLTVLPFFSGERAPGWREDARAHFAGISLHTTPLDLLQASLEAITYRFALIYKRIEPHLGRKRHSIIASGGAILSSPAWLQITADVLGRPLLTLAEKETTSRGGALLALEQLGVIDRPSDLPPATGELYEPDDQRHARHAEALANQVSLYKRAL